jgi:ABC-type lipopolysaccharide export system ATPase subunit
VVEQLAKSQQRTEKRVEELAEAQQRTDSRSRTSPSRSGGWRRRIRR